MSETKEVQETQTSPSSVSEFYSYIRVLVESMEEDALKNDKGNKAAGVRLRKSLRLLKNKSGEFVKFTLLD